jgi:ubiquinone/menaquinone biosynthesis C-methylase UbiE
MGTYTGERLETFISNQDSVDHLHRYSLALEYVKGRTVLDIASGEGYGSNILSKEAKFVIGVDIDHESIKFLVGTADKIPVDDNSIDVVVSFETIEHHTFHEEMMEEIQRVLKHDGILIISTPDKYYYSDLRNFKNPFHVKELYRDEFKNLLKRHFPKIQILNQYYLNGNSILLGEESTIKFYSGDFNEILPSNKFPLYIVAIASVIGHKNQPHSIFNGSQLLDRPIITQLNSIYQSYTYRLGYVLMTPWRLCRRHLFNLVKGR